MRKKPRNDIFEAMRAESRARKETNDCTVVSLAYALRITYDAAHLIMGQAGREHRRGASMRAAARLIEPGRLVEVKGLPYPSITLNEFCKTHTIGRYWVGVTGHALVVENGRVCDHSDKGRRRVDKAWRVYDKPTLRIGTDGTSSSE